MKNNTSITLTVGEVRPDSAFLTNIPMGLKGWNLMSFSNGNMMKNVSAELLDDTIIMGMSLVGLTFLAGLFVYIPHIGKRAPD